jgi:two-component system sensor histidine kinase/response regulator
MIQRQKSALEIKVKERTKQLFEANTELKHRQQEIEEQSEKLKNANIILEKQKKELRELNATKDKFFSIIAHDLKNPFNTILGFCEILTAKFQKMDKDMIWKYIDMLNRSSLKIYKLLENLLQWSRTQTNIIEFSPENISLSDIINSNLSLLSETAKKKQNELINRAEEDINVFADKNMLNTILMNILSNAIKFTEKGKIIISAKKNKNEVTVSVEDNGVGMNKKQLGKLFKIDKSASSRGTHGEEGTGLGLIICKDFAGKNGGRIWAESKEGKGTVFHFTVPLKN